MELHWAGQRRLKYNPQVSDDTGRMKERGIINEMNQPMEIEQMHFIVRLTEVYASTEEDEYPGN